MKLGCWYTPFKSVLNEAGIEASFKEIEVSDVIREKIDEIIHRYIGEKARYGHCSAEWRKFRSEIKTNKELRSKLVEELKSLV
jgi:septation ring formation regulator EzrA